METEILFEEIQSRTDKKTIGFFRAVLVIVFIAFILNLILQKGQSTGFTYFLMLIIVVLFIINLILPSSLTTQIRSDSIYVKFPPFRPSFVKFFWEDISEVYVRNYNAITEYYGYGFRISPNGTGYIVGGDTGIQIIFKNGNKVLITTQRADEVNEILRKIGRL